MRNDTVTNVVCYDSLIILSGNSWSKKYKLQKDHAMIRSRLRLLGRFLIAMRSVSPHVKQLSDVFKPQLYEQVVIAINEVAKFKYEDSSYCAPGTALGLGGLLKKVSEIYKIKLIAEDNTNEITNLNNFLTIFNHEISNDVNRTVRENICETKRRKSVILPKTEDIKKLSDYLHSNVMKYKKICKESCTLFNYKQLASYLLTDIQVFNRKRAGELERLLIGDYNAQLSQPDSPGYVCVEIRGKLMRSVPLLVSEFNNNCIKLLLQCRSQLGIREENPYVFALPSADDRFKYIRACNLLCQYSAECGVSEPNLLRGTLLRKHAATYASQLNFNDSQVQNLADHLGHETKIFREIYSQPIIKKQLSVAKFLEDAGGWNEGDINYSDFSVEETMEPDNNNLTSEPSTTSNKRRASVIDEDCPESKRFLFSEGLENTTLRTPVNFVSK
uniref:Tyr recombinase domain-containing protein n=1 Tax=Anoplophora glabripennis TaxID=217634 RepID=V5I905_ANOGL